MTAQKIRRLLAQAHALDIDLEIVHDRTDLRVDGDVQRDCLFLVVHLQEGAFGRHIDAVMNVLIGIAQYAVGRHAAHAALVNVRLVRNDERGRHTADRLAVGLVVIADSQHNFGGVGIALPAGSQNMIGQKRARLRVIEPIDRVADIVKIPGDFGLANLPFRPAQFAQDIPCPLGHD